MRRAALTPLNSPHPSPLPVRRGEGVASAASGVVYAADSPVGPPSRCLTERLTGRSCRGRTKGVEIGNRLPKVEGGRWKAVVGVPGQ